MSLAGLNPKHSSSFLDSEYDVPNSLILIWCHCSNAHLVKGVLDFSHLQDLFEHLGQKICALVSLDYTREAECGEKLGCHGHYLVLGHRFRESSGSSHDVE